MTTSRSILVLNAGSSSIKYSVFAYGESLTLIRDGQLSDIGSAATPSFSEAIRKVVEIIDQTGIPKPIAIGHRVVHSGRTLISHQLITPGVFREIEQATSLAPLHQPNALEIIRAVREHFPEAENYACFDTIFHQSMPASASHYPLSLDWRAKGLHRYGFHGLACESIRQQFLEKRVPSIATSDSVPSRLIIAHLGSGSSITALQNGQSIDTTMGLTPCGGIMMGTRSGDLDPGLIFYLLRACESSDRIGYVENMLNHESGLEAVSGLSPDMRKLRTFAAAGNAQAAFAIEGFVRAAKKAIGTFFALLDGFDALVFSGGIGENDSHTRAEICSGMLSLGIKLDYLKNVAPELGARLISAPESKVAVYVIPAEENRMIAWHVVAMLAAAVF